jgi:sec-independent protein translocase protein TatC
MKAAGLEPQLQSLSPRDGIISYLKIATYAGLVISSPWIFYHLWKFISAGLYPNEKKYVHFAVPASAILFLAGAALAVLLVAPLTLQFCIMFNKEWLGISSAFTFQNYMSFMVGMMIAFGLAFQMLIVMFFLHKFGMLPVSAINKSRRFVILGIVVAASIITPGQDMISLAVLTVALYALFELGFFAIWLTSRRDDNSHHL